jgi:hypothetical protein
MVMLYKCTVRLDVYLTTPALFMSSVRMLQIGAQLDEGWIVAPDKGILFRPRLYIWNVIMKWSRRSVKCWSANQR